MSEVPSKEQAVSAVDTLVRYIESANGDLREGLARTPERVIESFDEILESITCVTHGKGGKIATMVSLMDLFPLSPQKVHLEPGLREKTKRHPNVRVNNNYPTLK